METRITKLFGISHPILQGGMAQVSEAVLAASVSNAGGVGIIAGGSERAEKIREEIHKARKLTDKPFGVNIMLMSPYAQEVAEMVAEEKIAFVTTGAGNPGKYMKMWHEAGIKVIPVVPSVALAKRMERSGADALVAEGCESGGHIGELTTMSLVPQVVDAVEIPVIAAGGIADGRGIAAAFMLGAEGVQIGTRFLCSEECQVHENFKNAVLKAKDTDTAVTGRVTGRTVRQIRNPFTRKVQEFERNFSDPEEFEKMIAGSLRKAAKDGNVEEGSVMAGQVAGMVKKVQPVREIIDEMMAQAQSLLGKK